MQVHIYKYILYPKFHPYNFLLTSAVRIFDNWFIKSELSEVVDELVNKAMTYIDKLTKGSQAMKMDSKQYKKGFRAYKNRKTKRAKRGR